MDGFCLDTASMHSCGRSSRTPLSLRRSHSHKSQRKPDDNAIINRCPSYHTPGTGKHTDYGCWWKGDNRYKTPSQTPAHRRSPILFLNNGTFLRQYKQRTLPMCTFAFGSVYASECHPGSSHYSHDHAQLHFQIASEYHCSSQ